ncbi:MAG: NUDIX hydrolase [Oscillospiraceae bacterium]|nr:NUDIX hydrolase [Oscillospiraceae bacterium]
MFYINARAIIERTFNGRKEVIIQWRNKHGEGCYEFPSERIEAFESFYDALRREVKEETGLDLVHATGQANRTQAEGGDWLVENFKPFSVYQTLAGPVDSLGAHFICHATGELLTQGDDSTNIQWISLDELKALLATPKQFSGIDKPAALLYLQESHP